MEMNLYQFLQDRPGLDFGTKIRILSDVAEAMEFMHLRGIIHRDLKSVNVLLNCGNEAIVAKVCPD